MLVKEFVFIDSMQFLNSRLETLAKNLPKDKFKYLPQESQEKHFRGGSRTAATSKMERFVNYYHKALHLGFCSSPRFASTFT